VALPREFRLKGRRAFEEFRRSGEVYYSRGIVLKTIRGKCGRKFAFIVTKRIGNAVRRNRTKRVLSEWIRLHLDLFPDGVHYLVIVRSPNVQEKELVQDLGDIAGKASLGK
jgi:ribonuclease P protein component